MTRPVVTTPETKSDLLRLYDHIEERSRPARALAHVERTKRYCAGSGRFPDRGTKLDDVSPGLRTVGFERRVTIAFTVGPDAVTIVRVLCGGRDLGRRSTHRPPRARQLAAASLKAT